MVLSCCYILKQIKKIKNNYSLMSIFTLLCQPNILIFHLKIIWLVLFQTKILKYNKMLKKKYMILYYICSAYALIFLFLIDNQVQVLFSQNRFGVIDYKHWIFMAIDILININIYYIVQISIHIVWYIDFCILNYDIFDENQWKESVNMLFQELYLIL